MTLEINNTASAINLTKFLKSWDKVTFNGEVVESIPDNTAGTIEIENAVALDVYSSSNSFRSAFPYGDINSSLVSLSGDLDTSGMTDMSYMFHRCKALTSLDLSNFDTTNVTGMSYMFYESTALTSLDLSNFNTSNVTNMRYMFYECRALTSLDLSSFYTSNVTDMSYMFYGCEALSSLNVSSFDTSKVTDMNNMFYSCTALSSLDLSNFNTSKVTNMSSMFYNCSALTSLDLSNFNTSKVTNMSFMFYESTALTSLGLSNFNTNSIYSMGSMFELCGVLTSLNLNGQGVTLDTVQKISDEATKLTQPKTIYVSSHDKHEGLEYANITYDCGGCPVVGEPKVLTLEINNTESAIDLTKFLKSWNKVKFNGVVVESIPGNTAGTIEIENAIGLDVYDFANKFPTNITSVSGDLDLTSCTSLESMFEYCSELATADLSKWEIKADNTKGMFDRCRALVAPVFNPNVVIKPVRLQNMLSNCDKLNNLDLSMFDFSSAVYYADVFKYCYALKNITALGRDKASNNKLGDIIQKYAPNNVTVMVDSPAAHDGLSYSSVTWVYPS